MTACDLPVACDRRQNTSRSGSATTPAIPEAPLALGLTQGAVERRRFLALTSAGSVVVRIPQLRARRMRRQVSLINSAPVRGFSWSLFFAGMAILRTVVLN